MTKPLYRPCVGVMLLNGAGLAFVGRRRPKGPHDLVNERFEWQMPQGGVDEGEAPVDAALRELYEETNVRSVEVLAEIEPWLSYDLPPESAKTVEGQIYRPDAKMVRAAFHGRGL